MTDERPWVTRVALLERDQSLPLDPTSAREARRLVREVLGEAERPEWLDAAELAVSEVVTNAVLHAHTAIHLWAGVYDDLVCLEVSDGNPVGPVVRHYDAQASTGRGLGLVASLAVDCGVRSDGAGGKAIWFCIGDKDDSLAPAEWDLDDFATTAGDGCRTVRLRSMPPTLWLAAQQHHDALLRELALYVAEHDDCTIDLSQVDRARSLISDAVAHAVAEAQADGRTRPAVPDGHPSPLPWVPENLDLELAVDPTEVGAFLALPDALDLAERLAVTGDLLILPALPEIIAVRDWACEQVVAQVAGSPAAAWSGAADERFETDTHGLVTPDEGSWDVRLVRDSDRGVVAADDANRIVAISRPLAEALGWEPQDLVGRRVVTLIPPAFREAHVAGFTRHLSTGEAHVLGVPLELPVLHAEGHEVRCRFLIERTAAGPGRSVYVAWIEPIEG